jgi:hypothetical protein
MFENYVSMSAEEKALVKSIHKSTRANAPTRYGNLAWGFVRGFLFRRIERTNRPHNEPDAFWLRKELERTVLASKAPPAWLPSEEALQAWLDNPEGAIPAPVREKRTSVRPEAAE